MNLILEEIKKGNTVVFKQFFTKHYEPLVVFANNYLFDYDASEDIVQEVFIYLWENSEKIKIDFSLLGYIHAMVRNRCLNYLKKIKVTDNFNLLAFNINLMSEPIFDSNYKHEEEDKKIVYYQILKIVETLPKKMQEVVKLKFFHNYKYSEIAKELNISVNTVKTQLKRAKLKITELIILILVVLTTNW